MLVVGLDPGGAKAFGWAVLAGTFSKPLYIGGGVCTGARQAIHSASRLISSAPDAIGIDAPMYWSALGDRRADACVRKSVCHAGGRGGTVSHVNSLQGACLVEGAIAAKLAKEAWPQARITEAHPKALLRVSSEAAAFGDQPVLFGAGYHLRDAAIGALAALAMLEKKVGWLDLAVQEPEPLLPFGVAVEYWFPQA